MTIGIYKLSFNDTQKVYIGQSSNIERRFNNHIHDMRHGTSSIKLQKAYKLYGIPSLEILEVCPINELDRLEIQYIEKYFSILEGFNTVKGGSSSGQGEDNAQALHTSETYKEILFYLVETSLSNKEIAEITDTSYSVVMHISSLSRHFWLEEECPELYSKLVALRAIGTKKCAAAVGKVYPKIKAPTGEIYEVLNITKFAKEHGLQSGALSALLNSTSRSTLGWCLATDTLPTPIKVLSPSKEEFYIGYREAKPFAVKHGLHPGDFAKVLKGLSKQCKGWTRG